MTHYKTPDNQLWDDMNGEAIGLPSWPQDAVLITDEEAVAIRQGYLSSLPAPPELTAAEKLQALGLTIDELKQLLAGK
jgi:hypothetical protein